MEIKVQYIVMYAVEQFIFGSSKETETRGEIGIGEESIIDYTVFGTSKRSILVVYSQRNLTETVLKFIKCAIYLLYFAVGDDFHLILGYGLTLG